VKLILDAPKIERGNLDTKMSSLSWHSQSIKLGENQIIIPKGEVISGKITVVFGPSGSGKTTLLRMLCGEIEGDCTSNKFSQTSFAKNVAIVEQSAYLPEGTVRELLHYGQIGRLTDSDIDEVLKQLGLELSLDQFVSERSVGVSIGQRRRLAIAHALLRKPNFLLLDEPSASLDELTEKQILNAVKGFAKSGGGVLAVAHRESFKAIADNLLEFGDA
jgi:ABC-type transport system involved in cytochrome bd biosynthesis fused ATPase/permease subunit